MRRRIIPGLIVCATMTLAGCGGDGDQAGDSRPVVGYLAVGGVTGVHYSTATQSGNTDITGAFRYLPGETVRFSVGGIELGSVPGTSQVTPFTLAGATPATTEPALRRELDRAARGPTPFLRAVNITHFLLALDADGVPENGLDVSAAGGALASATLDFNQGMYEFFVAFQRLPGEKNENIPWWRPVDHLYRAIGVAVSTHVPLRTQMRGGIGIFPGADSSINYRSDGLRESTSQDFTFDGIPEYGYRFSYDAMGRIITTRFQSGDFFGGINYVDESATEFDARGRYLRQLNRIDYLGDGTIDSTYVSEIEGDRFDGFQRQTVRFDTDADGVVDVIEVFERSADAALSVETATSRTDVGVDGTIDSVYEVISTFDTRRRIVLRTEEHDDNGDGVVDFRGMEAFSYTDAPSTSRSELSYDIDGDGNIDQSTITARTFDAAGNERMRRTEYDDDGDGIFNERFSLTATYDADRRRVTMVEDQDYTGDGITDYRVHEFNTYTDFGDPLLYRRELDFEADGVTDRHQEQRHEYGAGGELLGWQIFELEESATNPWRWMTVENIGFANGVRALAQNYLEFNAGRAVGAIAVAQN